MNYITQNNYQLPRQIIKYGLFITIFTNLVVGLALLFITVFPGLMFLYLITGFTASGGLHNHTVDPPNVNTTTNGNHNHNIKTAVDDASGPESQGYPSGNNQSRI
mgnify:CR=1 FL=1